MRISTLIPLASLLGLGGVLVIAAREGAPGHLAFDEPPPREEWPTPFPGIGTSVLSGQVLGEGDAPLAEARVSLLHRGRLMWAFGDAQGRFRIPEVDSGAHPVEVLALGYPPSVFEATAGDPTLVLRLAQRIPDPPVMAPIERSALTGRVSLPRPPQGVGAGEMYELVLLPRAGIPRLGAPIPVRVAIDQSGQIDIPELIHGDYRVLLLPDWARGGSWPDLLSETGGAPVNYSHPSGGELHVTSLGGEVRGRVSEGIARGSGRHGFLEGALIEVRSLPSTDEVGPPWPPVTSDAQGAFLVRHLPPGRYRVNITAGKLRVTKDVRVHAQATIDLDL